jgi:hypothetical protein
MGLLVYQYTKKVWKTFGLEPTALALGELRATIAPIPQVDVCVFRTQFRSGFQLTHDM